MPVLDVFLAPSPWDVPVSYRAILDTGADDTVIPRGFGKHLGLPLQGSTKLAGVDRIWYNVDIFRASLTIAGQSFLTDVREYGPELLIGRDILNQLDLRLDGPNLELLY